MFFPKELSELVSYHAKERGIEPWHLMVEALELWIDREKNTCGLPLTREKAAKDIQEFFGLKP